MIRPYVRHDGDIFREIYSAAGMAEVFPDLDSPLFVTKVVSEENGVPVMGMALQLVAEAYFFCDPTAGTPQQRWQRFLEIHEAARCQTYGFGLDVAYCYLPPKLEKSFGRKLERVGWAPNLWKSYTRQIQPKTTDLKEAMLCTSAK